VKEPWRAIATTVRRCRISMTESLAGRHREVEDRFAESAIT
jgi:hypothetical protein